MPPPSSGGVCLAQILNILSVFPMDYVEQGSSESYHLVASAFEASFADRSHWLGDPDFNVIPINELISIEYTDKLRKNINRHYRQAVKKPGDPWSIDTQKNTSHLSVIDSDGNMCSITTSVNSAFGSCVFVPELGIFLNSTMDDFSKSANKPNKYDLIGGNVNAIEPGKRPLSSMTPTIVERHGEVVLVTGSPGGSTIINIVMQMVLNVIEFDMNIAEASTAPRVHHQWLPDVVMAESGVSRDTLDLLRERNFILPATPADGGSPYSSTLGRTNSITHHDGIYYGFSDLRGPEQGIAGY